MNINMYFYIYILNICQESKGEYFSSSIRIQFHSILKITKLIKEELSFKYLYSVQTFS